MTHTMLTHETRAASRQPSVYADGPWSKIKQKRAMTREALMHRQVHGPRSQVQAVMDPSPPWDPSPCMGSPAERHHGIPPPSWDPALP
eukprot:CAMPEP_0181185482 /NCGR_PEP_ID=MMETSP1096-20121128/9528_1 /TAXON_ID=156174 ORGANISM="Chrysochromulina ericina, Strain CCMP281" /NCGR_SAMPLE_ID=MMETSP1096 /ASSEMBLY_ACC=CAM_ASM_000453 /LENGTH=87 /DNA_ID=CAMNT_0023274323 /DNA_START=106 /DNA_END=370 /DNA_ORIENTATION=-